MQCFISKVQAQRRVSKQQDMFFWLDEHLYKILKVCLETISINIDGDITSIKVQRLQDILLQNIYS